MQNFHCQIGKTSAFDSINKRFALEHRLVFQMGEIENIESKAAEINNHEITSDKAQIAVIGQIRQLCKPEIAAAAKEVRSMPNGTQGVNIYQKPYSLNNKALSELGGWNVSSELQKSQMWKDIVAALPGIDKKDGTLMNLMDLYKVEGPNLVPKDAVWLKVLKDGLDDSDKTKLQELEDLWSDTKETARDQLEKLKTELETAEKRAADAHLQVKENEAVNAGEVPETITQKLGEFTSKFQSSALPDGWNDYNANRKETELKNKSLEELLSIEDIKSTKFVADYMTTLEDKHVSFDVTPAQLEALKNTAQFAGDKLSFDKKAILNLQNQITENNVQALEPKAHIEHIINLMSGLGKMRQFAAAAHIYNAILSKIQTNEFTNLQNFHKEFYNRDGSLKKTGREGVGKYMADLGLQKALSKREYDNIFLILIPPLKVQYDLWLEREKRADAVAKREKETQRHETTTSETPIQRTDNSYEETSARELEEIEKRAEEARLREEEEKIQEKKEAEEKAAQNAALAEKKAEVSRIRNNISTYINGIDTKVAKFEDLKKWTDLQQTLTNEAIIEVNEEASFRELKNEYIAKTVNIFARDLQQLEKTEFIRKVRDEGIFVESLAQVVQGPTGTTTIPAKSTFREEVVFSKCLKQIDLTGELRYYSLNKDERAQLLKSVTKLFAPFRTEDDKKDTKPEEITDSMFAAFKSGDTEMVARRHEDSQSAESMTSIEKQDPFDDLSKDSKFSDALNRGNAFIKSGNIKNVISIFEDALSYVETNYDLSESGNIQDVIDKYVDFGLLYIGFLYKSIKNKSDVERLNKAWDRIYKTKEYTSHTGRLEQRFAQIKEIHEVKLIGFGKKTGKTTELGFANQIDGPLEKTIFLALEENALADNMDKDKKLIEEPSTYFLEGTYNFGNVEIKFTSDKIIIGSEEFTLEKGKKISLGYKNGRKRILEIVDTGTLPTGDTSIAYKLNDSSTKLVVVAKENQKIVIAKGDMEVKIPPESGEINVKKLADDLRALGKLEVREVEMAEAIAETEEPTKAGPTIQPETAETEVAEETLTETAKIDTLAKSLEEKFKAIDTLPDFVEILYLINPNIKKKDKPIGVNKDVLDAVVRRDNLDVRDHDQAYIVSFANDLEYSPAAGKAMKEATRVMNDVNNILADKRKSSAIPVIKHLIENIGKNDWQNLGGGQSSEWWRFRAYIYTIGQKNFKFNTHKNELPFTENDWEEIHAWFKEKTGTGANTIAEESPDPVEEEQIALLNALPKKNDDDSFSPEISVVDIAKISKENPIPNEADIMMHYFGKEVDWVHNETPERIQNIDAIDKAFYYIKKYCEKAIKDKQGAIKEIAQRLKDKDDTAKYPNVESFTNVEGLTHDEKRLLAKEFQFDEETFADETTRWLQIIIREKDIDAKLTVDGASANAKLKALPTDVDLIARQLIEEQVRKGVATLPGTLVATIELMQTRLADKTFRETVFTNVNREVEGSSLKAKYETLKESLQKEEAKLVLDTIFKTYSAEYPIRGKDSAQFIIDAEAKLKTAGIIFTEGNSSRALWDTAMAKAYAELIDPAMKNLQASMGAEPKMKNAVKNALKTVSPIPETQSFDEFLSAIATDGSDARKFLTYHNDSEKSAESISSKTYESLVPIYNSVWEAARDEVKKERESSQGSDQEKALAAALKELPDKAETTAAQITKTNPKINKDDLIKDVTKALQKSVSTNDRFKAEKDAMITAQFEEPDSSSYKSAVDSAFAAKMKYLTGEEKKSEVDAVLKMKIDFDQVLGEYSLTGFVDIEQKSKYEELAERFIRVSVETMANRMEAVFEIHDNKNAARQTWITDNEYDARKFLPEYFKLMHTEGFAQILLANKNVIDSAKKQLKENKHIQTTLLFDISVSEALGKKVKAADVSLIGKWIYPDRVPENITDTTDFSKILAPSRYLLWVRAEEMNDDTVALFHQSDRDNAEEAIREFLMTKLNEDNLGETAEKVSNYEVVPITELETATREIVKDNIFIDAGALETELVNLFEAKQSSEKQRIAINSNEGDLTEEGRRFRALALVAFEEKFKHLKSETTDKNPYTSDKELRESWLNVYKTYKLETFSPKSFEIFAQTNGRKHIDNGDPLDKALGELMTEAVMYYAGLYLGEALNKTDVESIRFRTSFAEVTQDSNIRYDEKLFFRAISELPTPNGKGTIHASIDYITHFLYNFDSFGFDEKAAGKITDATKKRDLQYMQSTDYASALSAEHEWENEIAPDQSVLDKVDDIVDAYLSEKNEAPQVSELFNILKLRENFPQNIIEKNHGIYFKVLDIAMGTIMEKAKSDTTILSWFELNLKYKLNEYIPELGKMDTIREFANKWVAPLSNGSESPNLKKTFAEFTADMNAESGLQNIYIYSFLMIEEAINKIILPAIEAAQKSTIEKANKTLGTKAKKKELADQAARKYHPETFRNLPTHNGTEKLYAQLIDSDIAINMAARAASFYAAELNITADPESLIVDSESRRNYFDFNNQKYDAEIFFANFIVKSNDIPKEIQNSKNFDLSEEQKNSIQAVLNTKSDMIFLDTILKIARKDKSYGSSKTGSLFQKITDPVSTMKSWMDENNHIIADKFIDWVAADTSNLATAEIIKGNLSEETKMTVLNTINENWMEELNAIVGPEEKMKYEINQAASNNKTVKAWSEIKDVKKIATLNEFTKIHLLPKISSENLSFAGKKLIESFIDHVSGDTTFKKKFNDNEKTVLGTLLRNVDYRNYITAIDQTFVNEKNMVVTALVSEALNAAASESTEEREENVENTKAKLEVRLRITPHDPMHAPNDATLGILKEITGNNIPNAEKQQNLYFEDLVNSVISQTEGVGNQLTKTALTKFYKGNPKNPTIAYFMMEVAETPEENKIYENLKFEIEGIRENKIKALAETELGSLATLLNKSGKTEAELKKMHTIKDNIESLRYIDESIQRITDAQKKEKYVNSTLQTLEDNTKSLSGKIKSTGIVIPDFDQFLIFLENTWGYDGKLRSSEDVKELEDKFEEEFRKQTEDGEMTIANMEHKVSLQKFLDVILTSKNQKEEIRNFINGFREEEQIQVGKQIITHILKNLIDRISDKEITEMKNSENGSFVKYIEHIKALTDSSDDEMRTIINETNIDDLLEKFYSKPGAPSDFDSDKKYQTWLDSTPDIMESNEFVSTLNTLIRNNTTLPDDTADLKSSLSHYQSMGKFKATLDENDYALEVATELNDLINEKLYMDTAKKTEYDGLENDSERLAMLIQIYKNDVQSQIEEIENKQRQVIEELRNDREATIKPNLGSMLAKAHMEKDKKNAYEIQQRTPEALAALPKSEQLKYALMRYHNQTLINLPTSDELNDEEFLYEKAQNLYMSMEKFTLDDVTRAIVEKGLKLKTRWDMIEVNDIPLKNFIPDSPYLADAVQLYMYGEKNEAPVMERNGFFYTYLRKTYKPKKDKAALLALTPDKLADDLVNACGIYREHLDNNYDIADKLREYQEETLGEESVTETLARLEEEKTEEENQLKKARLLERAASITNQEHRNVAEKLASSTDTSAAEALINGLLSETGSEISSATASKEGESHIEHESIYREADAEIKEMFTAINTFLNTEINSEDQNATLLHAAKLVIKDLLISTETANGISHPITASKLGKVFKTADIQIAAQLVKTIEQGNLDSVEPEVFDRMLMSLFEKANPFREIGAWDRLTLDTLRNDWLTAKEKEPQKITSELLREMLKKIPATENEIAQISSKIMRQWYKVQGEEMVFAEQSDTIKMILLIVNSFGFRLTDFPDPNGTGEISELTEEVVMKRILPILDFYHPKSKEIGDKNNDGSDDRDYTLQETYKSALLGLPEPEPQTWRDDGSAQKFEALKTKFFEAVGNIKDKKDKASTLPAYQEVLKHLSEKNASDAANPNHPMMRLFYEVLLTMQGPEISATPVKKEMTKREMAIDTERTKLAEEIALQGSMLERIYREEVLADAKSTIDKADGTYLKDSTVDFSNMRHLSRNVFSEKFRYHIKGGEFLTSKEAQTAYGTALDLLESSQAANRDIVGFGDFALHKFYKNTPGVDFPIQAKEKFFKDYKDIKDTLRIIAEHATKAPDETGFEDGYEKEAWYKEYKPLAKRVASTLLAQMVRDGILEKRERRTRKYLEEKLLRGEAPSSLMMMETEMENYMVSSTKILHVLENINEEIGVENVNEGKSVEELKKIKEYMERVHLLKTQRDIYKWYSKADTHTQEIHGQWFEKWKTESLNETLKSFGQPLIKNEITGFPQSLQDILSEYEAVRQDYQKAAHKDWSKEEIRQARRFDALHEDVIANTELGKPDTYTDKRFGDLFDQAVTNPNLEFADLNQASGPYSEHDIAFNYGLTAENSHLQSIDAIYVSKRMRNDFVKALETLDIRPDAKKRKMIDAFRANPDDIAKLFYAILGKEKVRKTKGNFKPHFGIDGAIWPVMDIPKNAVEEFVKNNGTIIQNLKWQSPTLRQLVEAKGTPGFAEFFERGIELEHLVFDQSEATMQKLKDSEHPLDDLMEYTLRIHEIGTRGKSIDRPNRAEIEEEAKEHYTDLYELYTNRDSAWEQYESRTFVASSDPEEKENEEMKLKTEITDKLLRDGISTLSFMYEYPVTWGKKYDKFVDVDTLFNLNEALNILLNMENESVEEESTMEKLIKLRDTDSEIFSKKNLKRISKLTSRHIEAIADTLQFGKIYAKAIEQGIARKEMVFSIFENGKGGSLDIAALLRAQDIAFKANGVDLTADELYKIGDDLRTRLDNNTIEPIELSREMEEAGKEYMDFRALLAFPEEGYAGMDDEAFMVWKHNVITKAKAAYTVRMQKLVAPFIDGELTPDALEKILFEYTEIQRLRSELKSLETTSPEYSAKKAEIQKYIEEADKSGIDDAVKKLEQLLINDYGELLHKSLTDLPEIDATDFFAGFGMNVDIASQRAALGWNAGLNLPKGHQIDLLLVTTPGQNAGFKVGGSKEWSGLGPDERGKVHVFAHGGASVGVAGGSLNLSGGIEYSRVEGGKEESYGSLGAFASAEIGNESPKATVGFMGALGKLSPEEREVKYKKGLEAAREGILKKEYARIDDYVDSVYADKSSKVREGLKDSIEKAMEDVFLRAVRDAEAGRAAMPKSVELTRFEAGIAFGFDAEDLGLGVNFHMAAVFSVDGKVFVTRFVTPEHIMDEASDKAIMRILEEKGITAGEMTLTAPLASDIYNTMSSEIAREMIDRSEGAKDVLIQVGEGGEKIYSADGKQGIALKRSYERSVAMGNLEDAKKALEKDFTLYMAVFKEKSSDAQIAWEDTSDLHKKRMRIFNTPGVTEIHIDPQAEELVHIDIDGNMVFDFASGFPIITKEVFEFESENYGANTVNIITIKFNRHFTRKEIEKSEKNYYIQLRNNEDTESKIVKMKPRRAIDRDLTMVERAKPKGSGEFFREVEQLYARAKHIDEMHKKFITRFGGTEAVNPKYEYISQADVSFIQDAVSAFIPDESNPKNPVEKTRRELIEKYFTLSIKIKEDESTGKMRLESEDQLNLTPTQTEETEKLILLIQNWYATYAKKQGRSEAKMNNYQLQYFLGQMVFETFYNIHRGTYGEWKTGGQKNTAEGRGGKPYFIGAGEIFSDAGTAQEPGKREKLRNGMNSLNNPVYSTMQNYLAHLHGSGKSMAKSIAENYVNNHNSDLTGTERENKIMQMTELLIGDSENAVHEILATKLGIDIPTAVEYCDYLAYYYFKRNGSDDINTRENLSFDTTAEQRIEAKLKEPATIKAFYETYENIFEGSQADQIQDENAQLLTALNASFASARHFRYDGWYIAGGRAVEAISANFGGLRKTFKYELGDEQTPEELEKARAVFEYMRPLPKLGQKGNEYYPMTDKEFFEVGGKDIRSDIVLKKSQHELEAAVRKSNETYDNLEITMLDVKEYLSTPLGLKVLEWAGVFLKEDQANTIFDLFNKVRGKTFDELDKDELLQGDIKKAFVEFVNINTVLREIEYFDANPESGKEAFHMVGLGGEEYETQIRYVPVENVDNGIHELLAAFNAIEDSNNFKTNVRIFLSKYAGIDETAIANLLLQSEADIKSSVQKIALEKFTPLSKDEREAALKRKDATKYISTVIKEENEREYLNQVNSRTMPDGSIRDVVPVAYIFKKSDPDNVIILNVGGVSATGTFLKCGNWSVLGQEQLTLFVQEVRQTVLEGGGSAMTRTADVVKPEIDTEYTRVSTGISGSCIVKGTPQPDIDENKLGDETEEGNTGLNNGTNEGNSSVGTDDPNRGDAPDDATPTIKSGGIPGRVPGNVVDFTPTEIGATTGTPLGKESPEGFSIRRGSEPEPKDDKKSQKPKQKKKDTTPEPDDLDTL